MKERRLTAAGTPPPHRRRRLTVSTPDGCAPVGMWLVGGVGVGTMFGDEVFDEVEEVELDCPVRLPPCCPSRAEKVGN